MDKIENVTDIEIAMLANQRKLIYIAGVIFIFIGLFSVGYSFVLERLTFTSLFIEITTIFILLLAIVLAKKDARIVDAARLVIYSTLACRYAAFYEDAWIFSPTTYFMAVYPMLTGILLSRKDSIIVLSLLILGTTIAVILHMDLLGGYDIQVLGNSISLLVVWISVFVFVDICTNYSLRLNDQLSKQFLDIANHDYLTQILNRRAIDKVLETEVQRAKRDKTKLTVMMIDVDYFKHYNDQFGHQKGDHCLKVIAKAIDNNLRTPPDNLGRYGGEEFLAVLPNTDSQQAINVGKRVQRSIAKQAIQFGYDEIKTITVTIGMVSTDLQVEDTSELLINIADKCLYKGKANGRNQIVQVARTIENNRVNLETNTFKAAQTPSK